VVFPRIRGVSDASAFAERLLAERETAVVPGRFFEAPAHVRLGFGSETDNVRGGLSALGAALDARAW
jgi:aspartate/methionine/tyrosine aminotransferase